MDSISGYDVGILQRNKMGLKEEEGYAEHIKRP